jgi:hypothetical protein
MLKEDEMMVVGGKEGGWEEFSTTLPQKTLCMDHSNRKTIIKFFNGVYTEIQKTI